MTWRSVGSLVNSMGVVVVLVAGFGQQDTRALALGLGVLLLNISWQIRLDPK